MSKQDRPEKEPYIVTIDAPRDSKPDSYDHSVKSLFFMDIFYSCTNTCW